MTSYEWAKQIKTGKKKIERRIQRSLIINLFFKVKSNFNDIRNLKIILIIITRSKCLLRHRPMS